MSRHEQRLNLEIGHKVKVEITGDETPVNAVFIGMDPDHFLVLRLPMAGGVHDYLYEGNVVVVKYVGAGRVQGFKAEVIGYLLKKKLLAVFLTYPEAVETYELRTEQRVNCYLPAHLTVNNQTMNGFVLDISINGCRFGFSPYNESPVNSEDIGKPATLAAGLLGLEGIQNISCTIKGVQPQGVTKSLGLQFVDLDKRIAEGISGYIRKVLSYLAAEESS